MREIDKANQKNCISISDIDYLHRILFSSFPTIFSLASHYILLVFSDRPSNILAVVWQRSNCLIGGKIISSSPFIRGIDGIAQTRVASAWKCLLSWLLFQLSTSVARSDIVLWLSDCGWSFHLKPDTCNQKGIKLFCLSHSRSSPVYSCPRSTLSVCHLFTHHFLFPCLCWGWESKRQILVSARNHWSWAPTLFSRPGLDLGPLKIWIAPEWM